MKKLKEQYFDLVCSKLSFSKEDLTIEEKQIIEYAFELFEEKLEEIKLLQDENRKIKIDFLNLKSYTDNNDYGGIHDDEDEVDSIED